MGNACARARAHAHLCITVRGTCRLPFAFLGSSSPALLPSVLSTSETVARIGSPSVYPLPRFELHNTDLRNRAESRQHTSELIHTRSLFRLMALDLLSFLDFRSSYFTHLLLRLVCSVGQGRTCTSHLVPTSRSSARGFPSATQKVLAFSMLSYTDFWKFVCPVFFLR